MKKLVVMMIGLACMLSLTLGAAEHKELTDAQKAEKQALLDKYDTNKDGKLDKDEISKMSDEDKAKAKELHLGGDHKKKAQ